MKRRPQALTVVHGWPDDRIVAAAIDAAGTLSVTRLGTPSFLDHIAGELTTQTLWLGPGTPEQSRYQPGPTLNYIADADVCGAALQAALKLSAASPAPWFNHPAAVLASTRDQVMRRLGGLPGVLAPATVRLQRPGQKHVLQAIESGGIGYPAIVRIAGGHGGHGTVRLDDSSAIDTLDVMPWGGRDLYVSRFIDYRSSDGFYRKHRFVFVGGVPVLRHVVIGRRWLLNFDDSLFVAATLAEEERALRAPIDALLPGLANILQAIQGQIGLDFFGLDCCLREDGTLLVFEANASMNILFNDYPDPNIWQSAVARIRTELLGLLDQPERWWMQRLASAPS